MKQIKYALTGLILAMMVAACTQSAPNKQTKIDQSKVLVTVNGEPITEKRYERFRSRLNRPAQADIDQEVIEKLVNRILLAQHATKNSLDKELDVYLALAYQREGVLAEAASLKLLKKAKPITDRELKLRYEKELRNVNKTEYRVSHIVVQNKKRAAAIIGALDRGRDFAKLAKKHSTGPSAKKGGSLGWIAEGTVDPEFFRAVTQLKKGKLIKTPVETRYGWHVIRVENTRPFQPPPLKKVKTNVKRLVTKERLEEAITEIRIEAKIVNHSLNKKSTTP